MMKNPSLVVAILSMRIGIGWAQSKQGGKLRNLALHGGQENQCIRDVVRRLGVDEYEHTDPPLLQDILRNDMFLYDLECMKARLGEKLTKQQSLHPMIAKVRNSIDKKHPMVAEFLCKALEEDLIPEVVDSDEKDIIKRTVHHTYLLELITKEMASDRQLMMEVQSHLLAARERLGLPSDFYDFAILFSSLTGQLFEAIKTKTLDWVFQQYGVIQDRGEILPAESQARSQGLTLNILEACIAENLNGFQNNAMAGIALAINPTEEVRVVGEERFLEYELSQDWVSLYESWNLAFITGNVQYLNLLYPKLLIPSVIDAEPDKYMFSRALSLWVSGNFFLFAQITHKHEPVVPNAHVLAKLWGEINSKKANAFLLEQKGIELDDCDDCAFYLGFTYADLWAQLKLYLVESGVITSEEAQKLTELLVEP